MIDFRPQYRALTPREVQTIEDIKSLAEGLDRCFDGFNSREIAIARTHLETAVMFAVKAVTA